MQSHNLHLKLRTFKETICKSSTVPVPFIEDDFVIAKT